MEEGRIVENYRKKPVIIQAIRWLGSNWGEVCDFVPVPEVARGDIEALRADPNRMPIIIHTLEGKMKAEIGDWIIKGIKGEFYPCKDEIFRATYEKVEQHAT